MDLKFASAPFRECSYACWVKTVRRAQALFLCCMWWARWCVRAETSMQSRSMESENTHQRAKASVFGVGFSPWWKICEHTGPSLSSLWPAQGRVCVCVSICMCVCVMSVSGFVIFPESNSVLSKTREFATSK